MCDATVVATPMKVGEWVQIKNSVAKEKPVPQTVQKLTTDHSDRSVIFHRVKESESLEPRTRFEHDIELIKELLKQIIPQNIPVVTFLNVYRLSSQMELKQNQTRLLKVAV